MAPYSVKFTRHESFEHCITFERKPTHKETLVLDNLLATSCGLDELQDGLLDLDMHILSFGVAGTSLGCSFEPELT